MKFFYRNMLLLVILCTGFSFNAVSAEDASTEKPSLWEKTVEFFENGWNSTKEVSEEAWDATTDAVGLSE
jgi:hypothetical protein